MSKLAELRASAAAGVSRVKMNSADAHLAMREHIQNGGRFKDHKIAQAVVRAMNVSDELPDDLRAKAEAKLFELLKADEIEGVSIERAD